MLATARRVGVRSVTNWATSIDIADVRDVVLARSVADQPLPIATAPRFASSSRTAAASTG